MALKVHKAAAVCPNNYFARQFAVDDFISFSFSFFFHTSSLIFFNSCSCVHTTQNYVFFQSSWGLLERSDAHLTHKLRPHCSQITEICMTMCLPNDLAITYLLVTRDKFPCLGILHLFFFFEKSQSCYTPPAQSLVVPAECPKIWEAST